MNKRKLEMLSKDSIDASVRDMMSLKAYDTWIKKSRKRDKITYYRGYLVEPSIQPIAPTQDRKRVEKLQQAVLATYFSDLVTLVQKRHGRFDYEYMAVRK